MFVHIAGSFGRLAREAHRRLREYGWPSFTKCHDVVLGAEPDPEFRKLFAGFFFLFLSGTVAAAQDGRCDQEQAKKESKGSPTRRDRLRRPISSLRDGRVDERRWQRASLEAKKAWRSKSIAPPPRRQHHAADRRLPFRDRQNSPPIHATS